MVDLSIIYQVVEDKLQRPTPSAHGRLKYYYTGLSNACYHSIVVRYLNITIVFGQFKGVWLI